MQHKIKMDMKEDWPHLWVVVFLSLLVYLWSAPRTVVLGDDGLFILAAYFNGLAHPPGYPLYTLLAHVSTWLPIGSIAYRVHLLSALFASLTCACVWWIMKMLIGRKTYAYAAAFSLAFSKVFWSQAIIAEVYTLNAFLFALCIILSLHIASQPQGSNINRPMKYLLLVYGLSLSNHWPLIILSSPMLFAILWPQIKTVIRTLPSTFVYLLMGLTPYVWMIVRSQMDPQISFYGPLKSIADVIFYISREGYANIDKTPSADWYDRFLFCKFVLNETMVQFGVIGCFFMVIGLLLQWRLLAFNKSMALLLGYLGSTFVLIGLLRFDYDQSYQIVFRVYPIIAYLCAALWLGLGLYATVTFISGKLGLNIRQAVFARALVFLVSGAVILSNVTKNYRGNDVWAKNYAFTILNTLPRNAVLFVRGDENIGPIGYMNQVEGLRDDVTLFHARGSFFKNRLFRPLKVDEARAHNAINNFIIATDRPVYYMEVDWMGYGVEDYGLVRRLLKNEGNHYRRVTMLPQVQEYFFSLINQPESVTNTEKLHRQWLYAKGCRVFTLLNTFEKGMDRADELRRHLCSGLLGKYIVVGMELLMLQPDVIKMRTLLREAEKMLDDQAVVKEHESRLHYLKGKIHEMLGDHLKAIDNFDQSILVWDHPENEAIAAKAQLTEEGDPRISTLIKSN